MNTFISISEHDLNTILYAVSVGALFFTGAIFLMVFLFGMSIKDTLKNTHGLIGLVTLSILVSIIARSNPTFSKLSIKAEESKVIQNFESIILEDGLVFINFSTKEPVISYIEHTDTEGERYPILPTYTLEKRTDHAFIMERQMLEEGTNTIIVGKKEIEFPKEER